MSTITVKPQGQTLTVDIKNPAGDRATDVLAVTLKSLTSDVATLTTASAHNLAVGNTVVVAGVDSTFNGTVTVVDVPTATTFTYAKTHADVEEAAATGTASVQAALNADGARVEFPLEITADTTWTFAAPFGSWVVTCTLADDTVVDERTVSVTPTLPAVVAPVMSAAQVAKYVSATVTA